MSKVAVILADGVETIEALTVVDVLRRAKIECHTFSIGSVNVTTSHGIEIKSDKIFSDEINDYDMIVLPGGMPGSANLRDDERVISLIKKFNSENKLISAICAAPIALGKAGILEGKSATCYPGFEEQLTGCNFKEDLIVRDGNLLTARGPAVTLPFSYEILKVLGYEKVDDIISGMLFDRLIK